MSDVTPLVNTKDISSLSIGVSDFQKLILANYYIVDKTLLIKEIMDDSAEVILITRPRRFGKTLNLSMLYYFIQNHLNEKHNLCLLYTSPSPRDRTRSRMPSSA